MYFLIGECEANPSIRLFPTSSPSQRKYCSLGEGLEITLGEEKVAAHLISTVPSFQVPPPCAVPLQPVHDLELRQRCATFNFTN